MLFTFIPPAVTIDIEIHIENALSNDLANDYEKSLENVIYNAILKPLGYFVPTSFENVTVFIFHLTVIAGYQPSTSSLNVDHAGELSIATTLTYLYGLPKRPMATWIHPLHPAI